MQLTFKVCTSIHKFLLILTLVGTKTYVRQGLGVAQITTALSQLSLSLERIDGGQLLHSCIMLDCRSTDRAMILHLEHDSYQYYFTNPGCLWPNLGSQCRIMEQKHHSFVHSFKEVTTHEFARFYTSEGFSAYKSLSSLTYIFDCDTRLYTHENEKLSPPKSTICNETSMICKVQRVRIAFPTYIITCH